MLSLCRLQLLFLDISALVSPNLSCSASYVDSPVLVTASPPFAVTRVCPPPPPHTHTHTTSPSVCRAITVCLSICSSVCLSCGRSIFPQPTRSLTMIHLQRQLLNTNCPKRKFHSPPPCSYPPVHHTASQSHDTHSTQLARCLCFTPWSHPANTPISHGRGRAMHHHDLKASFTPGLLDSQFTSPRAAPAQMLHRSDFGPVALTSASAVNSLIQLAKLESIDLSEMSCETSEQLRGIASAAFFIGILLWQGSQGDIGMWWRLNFIRHVAMTSLMLVFSYQGTGNPCSLVYNQDTAMWLKMLKVCSAAFALNAWMEVGGRLLLPSWFCVNLAMFADTFWIHTPGPNDMMERVIPHMVGSTAAILWISARQASAMQSFLKMQLR